MIQSASLTLLDKLINKHESRSDGRQQVPRQQMEKAESSRASKKN